MIAMKLFRTTGVLLVLGALPMSPQLAAQEPPPDDGAADRAAAVDALTRIAEPVLAALSQEQLKATMPVRPWEGEREAFTHVEAFARTLAGVAPWLELGPDETEEGQERARFIEMARQAVINGTDPASPDFMDFSGSQGDQPLVEGAYFAAALMAAPTQLWEPLTGEQQENVVEALQTALTIENFHDNNWWLFPAMIEAALWQLTGEVDKAPIEKAIDKLDGWYLGDGLYGDGETFSWDYYNSYVIHPMLLQVLAVAEEDDDPIADFLETEMPRALRYAEVLERLVSPEGTFPVIGRSSGYRFAAFYHLAYMALRQDLPEAVDPGAARGAIAAVVARMIEAPGTFDEEGWLNLGAVGSQPGLQESYNSTGALYVALTGLVHLGLPADDPFWTAPAAPWTQQRIWSGEDVPVDHALEDEQEDEGTDDDGG